MFDLRTIFGVGDLISDVSGLKQRTALGLQRIELAKNRIIRQIKRKVGNISGDLETRIKNLYQEKFDILTEDLLDFNSLEDLLNWLENNQS